MKKRSKRLLLVLTLLTGIGVTITLVVTAFNENMLFFYSPSDVKAQKAPTDRSFRIGGLVEEGSLVREDDGLTVHFVVTDNAERVPVVYTGILPDLFREGQGVVAQGRLSPDGRFIADQVLAKHDETYMPPEVAEALERAKAQQSGNAAQVMEVAQ